MLFHNAVPSTFQTSKIKRQANKHLRQKQQQLWQRGAR